MPPHKGSTRDPQPRQRKAQQKRSVAYVDSGSDAQDTPPAATKKKRKDPISRGFVRTIRNRARHQGEVYGRKLRASHYYTRRAEWRAALKREPEPWHFDPYHSCIECIATVTIEEGRLVWARGSRCKPIRAKALASKQGPRPGWGCEYCHKPGRRACSLASASQPFIVNTAD
ncbi:hypothetical protein CALVIDRAFT_543567 [Calocera viscosa TUFC12733]|uniref:Uncharacterized protein n=1 Tax=Calocera viscosa (strain TUFC12733) TaxID=1330018 RepID=A0A167FDY4_CALVF|nr:hypothetical protein CALVIDRAFT_543567 [Calocera viscosa TUFC12733]